MGADVFSHAVVLAGRHAGGCPAATHFLLLRQEKVSKEKASRMRRPCALLRARCVARSGRGACKLACGSNMHAPDPPSPALLADAPRRRGQRGSSGFAGHCRAPRARAFVCTRPFCMRRGAQDRTGQDGRLFEPKASSSPAPAGPSTAGCPEQSGGTQTVGSPSFAHFSWRSKKSESPAGARPGMQPPTARGEPPKGVTC